MKRLSGWSFHSWQGELTQLVLCQTCQAGIIYLTDSHHSLKSSYHMKNYKTYKRPSHTNFCSRNVGYVHHRRLPLFLELWVMFIIDDSPLPNRTHQALMQSYRSLNSLNIGNQGPITQSNLQCCSLPTTLISLFKICTLPWDTSLLSRHLQVRLWERLAIQREFFSHSKTSTRSKHGS
jgi:hypothetical protein